MAKWLTDFAFDRTARRQRPSQDSRLCGGMCTVASKPCKAATDSDSSTIQWKLRTCCSSALSAAAIVASANFVINKSTSTNLYASGRSLRSQNNESVSADRLSVGVPLPDVIADIKGVYEKHKLQFKWVKNPVLLPDENELENMNIADTNKRTRYWIAAFGITHVGLVCVGTAIMWGGSKAKYNLFRSAAYTNLRGEMERDLSRAPSPLDAGRPTTHKISTGLAFSAICSTSAGAVIYSLKTRRLSKTTGLDFEFYYGLYCLLGGSMLSQAMIAVCVCPTWKFYGSASFLEASTLGMLPLVSDAPDSLKDVIFSGLCLSSESVILKATGGLSLLYLFGIHMYFLQKDGHALELAWSYVPGLMVQSKWASDESKWPSMSELRDKVFVQLYKQTTPTKTEIQMKENLLQALAAIMYLLIEGGSPWVSVMNVGYPVAQVLLGQLFYTTLKKDEAVHKYLTQQYVDGVIEQNETKQNAMLDELEKKLTDDAIKLILSSFFRKSLDCSMKIHLFDIAKKDGIWNVNPSSQPRGSYGDDGHNCVTFDGELSTDVCKLIAEEVHSGEHPPQLLKFRTQNKLELNSMEILLDKILKRGELSSLLYYKPKPMEGADQLLVDFKNNQQAVTFFYDKMDEYECVWIMERLRLCEKSPRMAVMGQISIESEKMLLDFFLEEFKSPQKRIELSIEKPVKVEFNRSNDEPAQVELRMGNKSFTEQNVKITAELQNVAGWLIKALTTLKELDKSRTWEHVGFDFFPECQWATDALFKLEAKQVFIPGESLNFTRDWELKHDGKGGNAGKVLYEEVLVTRAKMKNEKPLRQVSSEFKPTQGAVDMAAKASVEVWKYKHHNLFAKEMRLGPHDDEKDLNLPRSKNHPLERVIFEYNPRAILVSEAFGVGAQHVLIPGNPLIFNQEWQDVDGNVTDERHRLYIRVLISRRALGSKVLGSLLTQVRSEFIPSVEAVKEAEAAGASEWKYKHYDLFAREATMLPDDVEILQLPLPKLKLLKVEVEAMDQALAYFKVGSIRKIIEGLTERDISLRFTFDGSYKTVRDADIEDLAVSWPQNISQLCMKMSASLIGNDSVKHIANNLPQKLTELDLHLEDTQVGDVGLQYLATKLPKNLTRLSLHLNKLNVSKKILGQLQAAGPQGATEIS